MNAGRLLWAAGAYLAGTFPSAYVVARLRGAGDVIRASDRHRSEGDAHVLLKAALGPGWGAAAATTDVVKAFAYPLVGRHVGDLTVEWVALCGVLAVVGHAFPFYVRAMSGRGLAAAAGSALALLPVEMAVAGVVILLGFLSGLTGPASTLGFASVPVLAAMLGQPSALVAMGAGNLGVILARRMDGVAPVAARSGWLRALFYRLVFDRDGPPLRGSPATEDIPPG